MENFYEKPLQDLTNEEWEQICMKCGKCCMYKYSNGDVVYLSNQMCRFCDIEKGTCSCYFERFNTAKGECLKVSLDMLEKDIDILPPSCAYRSLYEGRGLPEYHPLLTGNPKSAVIAGKTIKSLPVFSENDKDKAIDAVLTTALTEKWSDDEIKCELSKIMKKFALKWLESYPLTNNKKRTIM